MFSAIHSRPHMPHLLGYTPLHSVQIPQEAGTHVPDVQRKREGEGSWSALLDHLKKDLKLHLQASVAPVCE